MSRAFTAPRLVADEKRERIYAAAKALGYVPNAIARSLSSHSSRIIAVVVPSASTYYQHALSEFAHQIAPTDYQLLLFEAFAQEDLNTVFASISRYHVDAVIVASNLVPVAQVQPLVDRGLPVLMFNRALENSSPMMSASVDNESGTRELARLLVDAGHRSVCFVGGIKTATTDRARYRGASERLAEAGIACRYVPGGAFTYDSGYKSARAVLDLPGPVDAIMAGSDLIACGLIDGLRECGLEVPAHMSVTGFGGLPQAAWKAYNLTTIDQPMVELARQSIDMLIGWVEGDEVLTGTNLLLEGTLLERGSVIDRHTAT